MLSAHAIVTIGAGLLLGVGVVVGWRHTWGSWHELRTDWRDFRAAAALARANRAERNDFARGKACTRCHVRVDPRGLYRTVRHGDVRTAATGWVYRCRCGESTLYDATGEGHHLDAVSVT